MIHIDQKIAIWERFSIEDENEEELMKFLNENPEATSLEIYDWAYGIGIDPVSEIVEGSDELLTYEDNKMQPTLEITIGNKVLHIS
jgi:hypothetical protein